MPTNKAYSEKLHQMYDRKGKEAAIAIMRDVFDSELITENTSERRGDFSEGFWDQSFRTPVGKCVVEVEIKENKKGCWGEHNIPANGVPFKYDTVDIPFRKEKCIADRHIVASSDGRFAAITSRANMDKAVADKGPKFKITEYEPDGGYYFAVPIEDCFFVIKRNGKWKPFLRE